MEEVLHSGSGKFRSGIGFSNFIPLPFAEKEWTRRVGGILVISGTENIFASVSISALGM